MKIFPKITKKIASFFSNSKAFDDDGGNWYTFFSENTSRDLRKLSKSEYMKFYVGRAFVAIGAIAEEIGGLTMQVTDKSGKVVTNDMLKLIDFDLLVNISSYLDLSGACYVWKNIVGGKVLELVVLRPDLVEIVRNPQKTKVTGYKYRPASNAQEKFLNVDEVLAFTNFSPYAPYPNNYIGMPTVQAIATAIDTDYQASKWNRKYFMNNASVNGVLETDDQIEQDKVKEIIEAREQKYRGTENAHKIGLLQGGLKYKPLSPSQKEMDFVESRRFNRDEILGFFKVPKAILGLGEGGNAMNVRSFDTIFARRTILPRSKNIQNIINQGIFAPLGLTFQFINVVPQDLDATRNDYAANGITLNEFRATRGLPPMDGGDRLRSEIMFDVVGTGDTGTSPTAPTQDEGETINQEALGSFYKEDTQIREIIKKSVTKALNISKRGTDEYNQKYREKKMERNTKYEKQYNDKLQTIFKGQEKEIMAEYKKRYDSSQKDIKAKMPLLSIAKRSAVYYDLLKPVQEDLVKDEGGDALVEVGLSEPFEITPTINKKLRTNIEKFAGSVDTDTNKKITTVLTNVIEQGLTVNEGVEQLQNVFTELKTSRAEKIVRTETIRAGNDATQRGREQSKVVSMKQRFTAEDERTCEFCGPLHGEIVELTETYFDKGETLNAISNETGNPITMKLDYSNTDHPPLHPNCRCVIVPVLDE